MGNSIPPQNALNNANNGKRPVAYMLPRYTTEEYIGLLTGAGCGTRALSRREAVDQLRSAHQQFNQWQQDSAQTPHASCSEPLTPKRQKLAKQILDRELTRCTFDIGKISIEWVEIDSLVVFQKYVDLENVEQRRRRMLASPGDICLFDFCFPEDGGGPQANVQMVNHAEGCLFQFTSESLDFRFLGWNAIPFTNVLNHSGGGNPVMAALMPVGYTTNYVTAVRCGARLILLNGTHRAYTLRSMGFTHMPCLIQEISGQDEIGVVFGNNADFIQNTPLFFQAPRPPLVADYFDPNLMATVETPRTLKRVVVNVQVSEETIPLP